jgi:single-strand DNA-binding protein
MSKDLNDCKFIGRLGQDVEVKFMPSGSAVANFSIACNDDYKDKSSGELVKQTNWIRVVMFGRQAELAGQHLSKGSQVFISGKQVTRKWQDKAGKDQYTTEIVANTMQFLGSKGDRGAPDDAGTSTGGGDYAGSGDPGFDDEIPFAKLSNTVYF